MPVIRWDSERKHSSITLSNDDIAATNTAESGLRSVLAIGHLDDYTTGKYFFEVFIDTAPADDFYGTFGIANLNFDHETNTFVGSSNSCGVEFAEAAPDDTGWKVGGGVIVEDIPVSFYTWFSVAVDMDNGRIALFDINGNQLGSDRYIENILPKPWRPACSVSRNSRVTINAVYPLNTTPPPGYEIWGKDFTPYRLAGSVTQDQASVTRSIRVMDAATKELELEEQSTGGQFDIRLSDRNQRYVAVIPAPGYEPLIEGPVIPAPVDPFFDYLETLSPDHWWSLDGDLLDTGQTPYDGTAQGIETYAPGIRDVRQSIETSAGQFATVGALRDSLNGVQSLTFLICVRDIGTQPTVAHIMEIGDEADGTYIDFAIKNGQLQTSLRQDGGALNEITSTISDANFIIAEIAFNEGPIEGQAQTKIWVNGSLENDAPGTMGVDFYISGATYPVDSLGAKVNASAPGGTDALEGRIQDVAIFKRKLTAGERQTLFDKLTLK